MTIAKVGSRGLGAARGFKRAKDDFYPTEPALTRALLKVEPFIGSVWEPACGDGALSEILKQKGHPTVSTDLVSRGYGRGGIDFLTTRTLRAPNVITNPPFLHWQAFAQHALDLGALKVALLGRLLLLEGWDRSAFFQRTHLTRVWVVGRSKMRPPGTKDKGHGGMIAFAWFVWDWEAIEHFRSETPRINWIKPER